MVNGIESDSSGFAADTSLIKPLEDDSEIVTVNNDFNTICNWADHWRLNFNDTKSVYMLISKTSIVQMTLHYM